MKHYLSTTSAAFLALFALLPGHIQAQNATDVEGTVIQVLYITDQSFALSELSDLQLAGSVAEANPTSTVVAITCAGQDVDPDVCGTEPFTLTYGPRTLVASEVVGNLGVTLDCSIAESTRSAVCTAVIAAPVEIFTNPALDSSDISELLTASGEDLSSTTVAGTVSSSYITQIPVTVTAGQELLASASAQAAADSSNGAIRQSVAIRVALLAAGVISAFSVLA